MRKILGCGLVCMLVLCVIAYAASPFDYLLEKIKNVLPDAYRLEHLEHADEWMRVVDERDEVVGYATSSYPAVKDIMGYAGPTPVLIVLDGEGVVVQVVLIDSNETPFFMRKLSEAQFFTSWNGLQWHEMQSVHVDAVTGATLSSEAIINTVRARIGMVKEPK